MNTNNIENNKILYKTLGHTGVILLSELDRKKQNIFSIEDASEILKIDRKKLINLLYELKKKNWLMRIQKGIFLVLPIGITSKKQYQEHPFLMASYLVQPYYIGYWSMLNYYGYTEQLSKTIFIAITKRKKNITISGIDYKFINISDKKMYGITDVEINQRKILVSDKEKTLIDCFDHSEYCGGIIEAVKALWYARNDCDFNKLLNYAVEIDNSAVLKRLGYIIELLKLSDKIDCNKLRNYISQGYSLLDILSPAKGKYITKWNLIANITEEDLLSWRV